ncbi:hypothetical protein Adt_42559 [Abeliophyllum distichum]|uniref:Uncharacterized protein n=1 Tax=Abeliophyllum distichum TaxID=126358 RepID=A0ABD1PS03_9LAMI
MFDGKREGFNTNQLGKSGSGGTWRRERPRMLWIHEVALSFACWEQGYLVPDLCTGACPGDIVELRVEDKVPADRRVAVLKINGGGRDLAMGWGSGEYEVILCFLKVMRLYL